MTRWHRNACWRCLPTACLDRFSALVESGTRFSALVEAETGFSALVETETSFSALVETEILFSALVETETCFSVHLLLHFHFLGVQLTSADRARRGGGGIDSCGRCDAVSTAMCAASAMGGMCGCGDALATAI